MASNGIQIPSLCIPRVYFQFDEAYIEQVFVSIFGGVPNGDQGMKSCIQKIDLVGREDRKQGNHLILFYPFSRWSRKYLKPSRLLKRLNLVKKADVCHPWFWKAARTMRQDMNRDKIRINRE